MDPYYGTTDDGTDLYGSPGAFTDENGVALGVSAGTGITLADGSSMTLAGAPATDVSPTSNSTSWISGLGSLFGSIGTTLTNVTRATNSPRINPATGVNYGINPATGRSYPNTNTTSQNSFLLIAIVLVVGWLVFKG